MNPLDAFISVTALAATILVAVYAAKTYHREPAEEEILPWDPWY